MSLTLNRTMVSGNFFDLLGAHALMGRLLRPGDDGTYLTGDGRVDQRDHALVLSYGAWRRFFGGDPAVVGRRVVEAYGQMRYTIVGVAPPEPRLSGRRGGLDDALDNLLTGYAVARLEPGATAASARDEFLAIEQRVLPEYHFVGATVTPFRRAVLGDTRALIIVLTAAVALLLLIACVNVGNLLLLRTTSRAQREFAIRRALGASSGDVARQLLVESAGLGFGGGALGYACAGILLRLLIAFAPSRTPGLDAVRAAGVPLLLATGVTLVVVVLVGFLPVLSVTGRRDHEATLRADARAGTETRARRHVRESLVAAQVALALVLLAGAGLLVRSLKRLTHLDLGYASEHLGILSFAWPTTKYNSTEKINALGAQVVSRVRAIPGIVAE